MIDKYIKYCKEIKKAYTEFMKAKKYILVSPTTSLKQVIEDTPTMDEYVASFDNPNRVSPKIFRPPLLNKTPAIERAVLAEREACAKLCLETGAYTDELEMAIMCADAIRDRS